MKVRSMIKAFILFIMVLPAYAGAAQLGELRLSLVEGDVQQKSEDTDEWFPASVNMPLRDGDRIWVPGRARAEIQSRNGSAVRLDENTSVEILTVDNNSLQFYLSLGQAYLHFRSKRDNIIQMDTPVSSIRVYDETKFNVAVAKSGDTDISVFRGSLYAENRRGKTRVRSGQMLSLGDNYAELLPLGKSDEWEEWNKERDKSFEKRGYSSQYLPEELEEYSSDLDNNGRWIHTSSYGYVWTPTLHISVGWSPYRNGRWVWIGSDYVWIAYEPWGWAPYHYGRWSFIASLGWCWVPPVRGDVYWSPGYVGWVYTPTYVSWVPLAPREIYYGYGHYGRHSVNIINVNINKVVVKEVYKNVYVNNAVTVVNKETFLRGKKSDFKIRENPFLSERISVGRPKIEPERTTRIPVIKEIPREKEPPKIVRDIEVRELKEKRRFVREPNRSVFVPETSPQTMPVRKIKEPKTGETIRPQESEEKPGKRSMQRLEIEQSGSTQPASRRKLRDSEQPMREREKQLGQDDGKTRQEMRTVPKQKLQVSAGEKAAETEETTVPHAETGGKYNEERQPAIESGKQNRKDERKSENKRKDASPTASGKFSQQQDAGDAPNNIGMEQEKNVKDDRKSRDDNRMQEPERGYQKRR